MPRSTRAMRKTGPLRNSRTSAKAAMDNTMRHASCHLLRLPRELRDMIYSLVCGGWLDEAVLKPRGNGNLVHKRFSLARVNKQLREEFLSALRRHSPFIAVHVRDFDFSNLITFFNRCNERDLRMFKRSAGPAGGKRRLVVYLTLTEQAPYFLDRLRRWANRATRPEKKGVNLNIHYSPVTWYPKELGGLLVDVNTICEAMEDRRKRLVLRDIMGAMMCWSPYVPGWLLEALREDDERPGDNRI